MHNNKNGEKAMMMVWGGFVSRKWHALVYKTKGTFVA